MKKEINRTACVILAAGQSSRMGRHKALLKFSEEQNFIDRIIEVYKSYGIKEIVIVASESLKNELNIELDQKIIVNNHPEYERFYSVKLACEALDDNIEQCFLQNCDNPFVNQDLLNDLINEKAESDCVIPVHKDRGGHPILINGKIIDYIKSIDGKNSNLKDVLGYFKLHKVATDDETVLININSKEEYEHYFKII